MQLTLHILAIVILTLVMTVGGKCRILTLMMTVGGKCRIYKNTCFYHWVTSFLSTGHRLLGVSFITSMKWNLLVALTTENTAQKVTVLSLTQNRTTGLQLHVFLSGICRVLLKDKGRSAFASVNSCQGKLKIPQSVSVYVNHLKVLKSSICKQSALRLY